MNKAKIGRALAYAGLALGTTLAAVSPARADEPVLFYQYNFYSDASHTTLVGFYREKCTYFGVFAEGPIQGEYSAYSEMLPIAYCGEYGIEYPL